MPDNSHGVYSIHDISCVLIMGNWMTIYSGGARAETGQKHDSGHVSRESRHIFELSHKVAKCFTAQYTLVHRLSCRALQHVSQGCFRVYRQYLMLEFKMASSTPRAILSGTDGS